MSTMEPIHFSRKDLEDLELPLDAVISGTKYLASYNWVESEVPTIAIPGCPALWTPPNGPQQLKKDTGFYYIAQNAARHPESPLEPLFRAITTTDPAFDMTDVDIITDRNNLRKLLSFAARSQMGRSPEAFTINFEFVGKTLLMCRDEAATHEYIEPGEFRGFGHEFEKTFTTSQVRNSTGHHRIIYYHFAGLKLIVRHETDGFVSVDSSHKHTDAEDNLLAAMAGDLTLSATTNALRQASSSSKLRVENSGREVPLHSTLEIKTRAFSRPLELCDVAQQLWISQTPKLVRAYHRRGLFYTPLVEDVTSNIKVWEAESQPDLRRFAALLKEIATVVKHLGGRVSSKSDITGDALIFRRSGEKRMLPQELYLMWHNKSIDLATSRAVNPDASQATATKSEVAYADLIREAQQKGFRMFFRELPTRLADFRRLCDSLDMENVDVLGGRQMRNIIYDFRTGKPEWDPEEGRNTRGSKSLARDSAFRFLYLLLRGDAGDGNSAYNATLFVVSHRRIFQYRTRKMIREAYMDQFVCSFKQQKELDKWPLHPNGFGGSEEEDVTTEEDEAYFYSDSS